MIKREDEYFLLTNLYSKKELVVEQIKTKIVINRSNPYHSYCLLYPPSQDFRKFNLWEVQLRGHLKGSSGKAIGNIQVDKAYCEQNVTTYLPDWQETEVKLHPSEILITHFHEGTSSNGEIIFNLTKNKFLNSSLISMGEKENSFELINLKPKITLNFTNGDNLIFDEFLTFQNKGEECISAVAQLLKLIEKNISGGFPKEQLLENIDNLLWFISFITNTKTIWTSLAFDQKGGMVEFFRCNMRYQNNSSKDEEPLVETELMQEFLQKCLERIEKKDSYSLYLPLIYFVGAKEKTLEFKFLALFMSLVVLLNIFCKSQAETTFIKDEAEIKDFIAHMKSAIEAFKFSDPKVKEFITRKLGSLNEVSVKLQFEKFCNSKGVDVSDLWPIFDDKIKMPLYRIRNKLMHGENLSDFEYLDIACEHLSWIVVRCLLADLDWRKSSKVDTKELRKIVYYNFKGV
jgi:hypothetical protein